MTSLELSIVDAEIHADGVCLLGPVTLQHAKPGITILLGPNGAGKSLFLALAHGLIASDRGTAEWGSVSAMQSRSSRGFMFQTTPVLRRSVAANIGFPLIGRTSGPADRRAKLQAALDISGLGDFARRPAAALSGGERQRMAFARAVVSEPAVVMLDEPSANLDPTATRALEDMVRGISADGVKIFMATHDLAQARRLATDILFFHGGQLTERSDAKSFFSEPQSNEAQDFLRGHL